MLELNEIETTIAEYLSEENISFDVVNGRVIPSQKPSFDVDEVRENLKLMKRPRNAFEGWPL